MDWLPSPTFPSMDRAIVWDQPQVTATIFLSNRASTKQGVVRFTYNATPSKSSLLPHDIHMVL